jgi:hypothetical protein
MAEGRLRDWLPQLIQRTRSGKMDWAPLPTEGENAFVHLLPGGAGSLVVRRQYSTHQIELRNATGDQLESVGELQQVAEVATLWQLIEAKRHPAADPYTALEKDLGS